MPYRYLEDLTMADVAFCAWAPTLEALFASAAEAVMEVMVKLDTVEPRQQRKIELEEESADMLLLNFLQEFIFYKDAERLLLKPSRITITTAPLRLSAEVFGETIDVERHRLKVDVKAATLHKFRLEKTDRGWECVVILDV